MPSPPYSLSFLIPQTGLSSSLIFCSTLYFSHGICHGLSFNCFILVLFLILKARKTALTPLCNPAASYLWGRLLLVETKWFRKIMWHNGKQHRIWSQDSCVPALPFIRCEALGKSLNLACKMRILLPDGARREVTWKCCNSTENWAMFIIFLTENWCSLSIEILFAGPTLLH